MKNVIVLNAAGGLFLLYLMIFMIRMFRIRKKCSPVHKHPVRVEQYPKSPKHLIAILSIVILWGLCLFGIIYYELIKVLLLYLSAIIGMTSYFPLFRQGKIGQHGIAIADTFIPWQDVEHAEITPPNLSDFHYPDHTLSVFTKKGSHYRLIVNKETLKPIAQLLTENELK